MRNRPLLIRSQDLARNFPGSVPPVASVLTKGTYKTLNSVPEGGTAVELDTFWLSEPIYMPFPKGSWKLS